MEDWFPIGDVVITIMVSPDYRGSNYNYRFIPMWSQLGILRMPDCRAVMLGKAEEKKSPIRLRPLISGSLGKI